MVLAEPRTIFALKEIENNLTSCGEPDKSAYRNAPMVLAEPKTIHQLKEMENKLSAPHQEPDKSAYR